MRVRELMNRHLVTLRESSSCREAVARMHRNRIRHLPILGRDGALVGIVTDRDLRHCLFSPAISDEIGGAAIDKLLEAAPVAQTMSAPVITVTSEADVAIAARVMLEHKIGALPVLEGERLVGIVTETDLLRAVCRADADCSPEVAEVIVSRP